MWKSWAKNANQNLKCWIEHWTGLCSERGINTNCMRLIKSNAMKADVITNSLKWLPRNWRQASSARRISARPDPAIYSHIMHKLKIRAENVQNLLSPDSWCEWFIDGDAASVQRKFQFKLNFYWHIYVCYAHEHHPPGPTVLPLLRSIVPLHCNIRTSPHFGGETKRYIAKIL